MKSFFIFKTRHVLHFLEQGTQISLDTANSEPDQGVSYFYLNVLLLSFTIIIVLVWLFLLISVLLTVARAYSAQKSSDRGVSRNCGPLLTLPSLFYSALFAILSLIAAAKVVTLFVKFQNTVCADFESRGFDCFVCTSLAEGLCPCLISPNVCVFSEAACVMGSGAAHPISILHSSSTWK